MLRDIFSTQISKPQRSSIRQRASELGRILNKAGSKLQHKLDCKLPSLYHLLNIAKGTSWTALDNR